MLSIVLPVFNESRCNYLDDILGNLAQLSHAEIIIVDGGSTDNTVQRVRDGGFTAIELPNSSRAARLNHGLEATRGDLVFLHHPRSLVPWQILADLESVLAERQPCWGGLSHQFDDDHPLLSFTSWYSNRVRFDWRGIVYLDHCLFLSRHFIDQGYRFPDIEIFEDTGFSAAMKRCAKPIRLPDHCTTSAIRFRNNGVFRQALLNQFLKVAYWLKTSPTKMNRYYEKGLGLNKRSDG